MKRIFCLSIFVASLMLAAPAQAETWSCSYVVHLLDGKKTSYGWIFVRDGAGFRSLNHYGNRSKYDVIMENELAIHLYKTLKSLSGMSVVALYKKKKQFNHSMLTPPGEMRVVPRQLEGECVIH